MVTEYHVKCRSCKGEGMRGEKICSRCNGHGKIVTSRYPVTSYSQLVKDVESAEEFIQENKIKPFGIVVLWED